MMQCWPGGSNPPGYPLSDKSVPTDMCYAELSGDWDLDNDGLRGEYSGDYGSGGIDKDCEVAVGRIPYYGSISDVDSILQKTMDYETSAATDWREKILIPAAISNFGPPEDNSPYGSVDKTESEATFGANWGEYIKSLASTNGYQAYTLYEKGGGVSKHKLRYCYLDVRDSVGVAEPLWFCRLVGSRKRDRRLSAYLERRQQRR